VRRVSGALRLGKSLPPPDLVFVSYFLEDMVTWNTGGMLQVEKYGRVRRAVRVEGGSQRAVAREFGLSRQGVRKILQYAVPPGYQRQQPIKRPKLGPWLGVIDTILDDDKQRPAKQQHTAKRIFERLKEEHGFTGGYTIVKGYVRSYYPCRLGLPREYPPSDWVHSHP
jgi:ribosomal protein S14